MEGVKLVELCGVTIRYTHEIRETFNKALFGIPSFFLRQGGWNATKELLELGFVNRNGKCNCIREFRGLSGSWVWIERIFFFFLFFCRAMPCRAVVLLLACE